VDIGHRKSGAERDFASKTELLQKKQSPDSGLRKGLVRKPMDRNGHKKQGIKNE